MAHPDMCRVSFTQAPVASMWVVSLHSLFLYSDPPPPSDWRMGFSSQTFYRINTPTFSTSVVLHTYLWPPCESLPSTACFSTQTRP
jgi:hypothetical protein